MKGATITSSSSVFLKMRKMKNTLIIVISLLLLSSCSKQLIPTLYLMGDSTMADKPDLDYPERGWGQLLPVFFDSAQLKIENHAKNGRSTRSFIYEGRWDSLSAKLKEGDFLVIQFGHNDGGIQKTDRYATPAEYRYNLKKVRRRGAKQRSKSYFMHTHRSPQF